MKTKTKPKKSNIRSAKNLIDALETALKIIDIPPLYTFVSVEFLEENLAWLFRYEKAYTRLFNNKNDEHFSFIVDALSKELKGLIFRDESLVECKPMDREKAYQKATIFLNKIDLKLKQSLNFIGIEPDSIVMSRSNAVHKENIAIAGIKVKFRHEISQTHTCMTLGKRGQIVDFVMETE